MLPLLGLALNGVYPAASNHFVRGALLPHLFTLTLAGGLFSVALSLRFPWLDVIQRCVSVEPGLSSVLKNTALAHPS